MPLYSIRAWGKFYGPYPFGGWYPTGPGFVSYAIYQRRHVWHGIICIKEHYYNAPPRDVPWLSPYQQKFSYAIKEWQGLTEEEKKVYHSYSYPIQMSGYHKFLHYYLKEH